MAQPAPFIGRRQELAQLRRWLDDARDGRATVALICGELGIGKTRLVSELLADLPPEQVVGRGRWYESRELPAYIGFREALRGLIARDEVVRGLDCEDPHVQALARLGPEFSEALDCLAWSGDAASEDQYQLWRSVSLLISAAAAVAPTVIALDDLQWADAGSLALLGFLGGEIGDLPVLIVGTFREEDAPPGHTLHDTMADLLRDHVLQTMRLSGLSLGEVTQLAAALPIEVPAETIELIHGQTQGNPLFVEEVLRDLEEQRVQGRPHATAELAVPEGLDAVIARRLSGLSAECRLLLALASVYGREFAFPLIERMSELSRDALLKAVDEAVRAAAIVEVAPGRFAFHHPLLRSVIYGGLSPSERLTSHLKAAQALRAHFRPDAAAQAPEIARHLLAAGGLAEPRDIVTFCLAGAIDARRLFAFEEAQVLLEGGLHAVDRLPEADPKARADLLVQLGYAQTALGRPDDAARTYREAIAIYGTLDAQADVTDARRWLAASLAHYGRWRDVLEVTGEGLAEAPEERGYAYAGLLGSHAMALVVNQEVAEAGPWVDKLLDLAFDDSTRAVANHVAAAWHAWGGGEPDRAGAHFLRARELFLRAGQDATASQVALDHAVVAHFLGHGEEHREAEQAAEQLATSTGRVSVLADLYTVRGMVRSQRGEWQDAVHERERARAVSSEMGGTTIYGQLAERAEALEALWREGPEAARACLKTSHPLPNEPVLLALDNEAGDLDAVAARVKALAGRLPADGRGLFWLAVALPVASALATLREAAAPEWYPALLRYAGCFFVWHVVDIELARIQASRGNWAAAERHYEASEELCETQGLKPLLAGALYQHGGMLLKRRRPGDRARATSLLERSASISDALGLGYMRGKAQKLAEVRGPGRRPSTGPKGLTPREIMVLKALAQGHSNRQIAAELFVTEKTVSRHLEHIYNKVGVSNRGAAIAWAIGEGLA